MSQMDDSESDIWEYKPLNKKKKCQEPYPAAKRRCTRDTVKRDTSNPKDTVKKDTSNPRDTVKKDTSNPRDTVKRDTSNPKDTVKRDTSNPKDTVKRDTSNPKDTVKRDMSNPKDTVKKDTSTSRDTVKKDTSTSRDTVKRDTSNPRDTVKKDTSNPKDTVKKDTSNPKDTVKKDLSISRDTVKRDTSNPRDTVKRDTSNPRDTVKKDTSNPKDTVKRDTSNPKDTVKRNTSNPKDTVTRDTVKRDTSNPRDTVKKDTSNPRDTVKKDTSNPRDTVKKDTSNPKDTVRRDTSNSSNSPVNVPSHHEEEPSKRWTQSLSSQTSQTEDLFTSDRVGEESACPGGFCPLCQMPFSILLVQSDRGHVAECLDSHVPVKSKECPDGLRCSSNIPSHYKRYRHTLLAHSRATDTATDTVLPGPSQETRDAAGSVSESSQNRTSTLLREHCETTPTKPGNALLLLRSPGPREVRKRKGWSPSAKGPKSTSASQESKADVSSPRDGGCRALEVDRRSQEVDRRGQEVDRRGQEVDRRGQEVEVDGGDQALEGGFVKAEPSPYDDDEISYSPLSEFPAEFEVNGGELRKARESNDSPVLFSDTFSSDDELFVGLAERTESQLAAGNTRRSVAEEEEGGKVPNDVDPSKAGSQSAQSLVLERLRETLSAPSHLRSKSSSEHSVSTEGTSALRRGSSSQDSVTRTPPSASQEGRAAGLKQTDIGVFFGLKSLKETGKEAEGGSRQQNTRPRGSLPGGGEGRRGGRRGGAERRRRGGGGGGGLTETVTDTAEDSQAVKAARGGRGRGGEGGRGGRRRWNRWGRDGEPGEPRRCPFYKKIPGTKLAVDAFQYGAVEGVSAYFLTHFHSDHYAGLRKSSTLHIYCNRITGNLVKAKLKVSEEYVHILPMNLPVTVEGVRVTLLEANHCPGAAMLLMLLPDGQTVLHTGDFRADASMETYPELLGCRVQTLYLDTTYCSPENSFPTQQEVINFAANTAFELVTLTPRTLLVCGSYSVGKEKVFLALAEVLGSKVCLSRDKYTTMCCLEDQRIKGLITTDLRAAQVHVLPMMHLTFKYLQAYLDRLSGQYDQLVAFKPTGWTFGPQQEAVEDTRPRTCGNVTIYGIPYSEHSSFLELKRFVQWLRPLKIIPTVNVGSLAGRKAMERCFRDWLQETKPPRPPQDAST